MTHQANIVADVLRERKRQDEQWGEQNHDPFAWIVVLTEEVGEASQAALRAYFGKERDTIPHLQSYREEMVHIAAVAIAAIESLDRNQLA